MKRWQDTQSGNNIQAGLAWGGPTLETNEINGLPVVRFTGDDGLKIDPSAADLLNLTNYTIYVVGRINDLSAGQIFYANYRDPGTGVGVGISDAKFNRVKYHTTYYGTTNTDYELAEGDYYLFTISRDWMENSNLYMNGELIASTPGAASYYADSVASIGALDIGRQFLNGDIAEIRIYNGVDPDETVTAELIAKYAIDSGPVVPDRNATYLTAMTQYLANSYGASYYSEQWNTLYPDAAWDISIYEGDTLADPNTLNAHVFNHPYYMMIDIPLQAGQERTFTWHTAHSAAGPTSGYYGVTLFFNDGQYTNVPGITVFAELSNPSFFANTYYGGGWPYSAGVPGSGLIYIDLFSNLKVTMTDFEVYGQVVDIVPLQDAGQHPLSGKDGYKDMTGHFTLKVEALTDCVEYFAADANQDCYVNLADLAALADTWLACYKPEGCN